MSRTPSGQQRLEGPDLEALLERVRTEFGSDATIVEANRVRRGGVGGFFAKETYEVVLDVDQAPTAPATTASAAASVSDARIAGQGAAADDEPFVPFSLDQLASRVDDPAPDFTATLASAVQEAMRNQPDPDPDPDPSWPAAAAIAEVAPVVAATPKIARLVHGGLDGIDLAGSAAPAAPAAPVVPPAPVVPAPAAARPLVASRAPSQLAVAAPAPLALGNRDLEALASLGVPVERLALVERSDEPAAVALVRLLEQLPAPPSLPRSAGAVLAVVGERATARTLAAELAGLAGNAEIVVAGRGRGVELRTPADADERRRAWRRRRRPTLVVVDAAFGIDADPWAADMLAALEPVVALGHVDAGRKPEDVRAWADGLGGLDALAVDGLDRTTTPAAVLGAGIPVALLDRAPATPARWAALLTDRLASIAA